MEMVVSIIPGRNTLADWRSVYFGCSIAFDPADWPAIERGAAAIRDIVECDTAVYGINTGFGKLASVKIDKTSLAMLQRNLVLSHSVGVGEFLTPEIVRLIIALKIASMSHGASGVRPSIFDKLGAISARGLVPAVPAQGSVGASGDLAPLAHLASAMMGEGEFLVDGRPFPSMPILEENGIEPLVLSAKEGLALLNGTQVSTALALAGLFEIERAFEAAIITGVLSLEAAKGSDVPFDARIHALRPHPGQRDVATALRALVEGSAIRKSHGGASRVQDPYSLRCMPQVMGSCLDALRHAAQVLSIEAVSVSDNPLIFADEGDVLSGGNFHAEPVAFAADYLALAAVEIGSMAERRCSLLLDASFSGLPAFLTTNAGLNSGLMMGQITAAALVSENKQKATPATIDTIPTSANQEDHVSMATHGARRLLPMARNLQSIIGIELLTAAQGCDYHAPLRSSEPLERVRARLRAEVPMLKEDRRLAPDLAAAARLVASGEVAAAAGRDVLPTIDGVTNPFGR